MTLENLTIVPNDWRHAVLEKGFYPEDLPEDWRMDYFLGQFGCAIIPAADWMGAESEDVEDFLAELEDSLNPSNSLIFKLEETVELEVVQSVFCSMSQALRARVVAFLADSDDVAEIEGVPVISDKTPAAKIPSFGTLVSIDEVPSDPVSQTKLLQNLVQEHGESNLLVLVQAGNFNVADLVNMQSIAEWLGY